MGNLNKVEDLINAFLKMHGGMNNGYNTCISGVIYLDDKIETHLDWSTPKKENLTFKEYIKISKDLKNELIELMKKNNISMCVFKAIHIEYGVFETLVQLYYSQECKKLRLSI